MNWKANLYQLYQFCFNSINSVSIPSVWYINHFNLCFNSINFVPTVLFFVTKRTQRILSIVNDILSAKRTNWNVLSSKYIIYRIWIKFKQVSVSIYKTFMFIIDSDASVYIIIIYKSTILWMITVYNYKLQDEIISARIVDITLRHTQLIYNPSIQHILFYLQFRGGTYLIQIGIFNLNVYVFLSSCFANHVCE